MMSAYNGKSKRIKNALVALVEGIQYDTGSGGGQAFEQVIGSSHAAFEGWPNAQVLPGDVTVEKPTVNQADRTPAYFVRIRLPLEDTQQAQDAAYDQMYDLTDLVIDAVDQADYDGSLQDGTGLIAITMMNATRGDWIIEPSSNGINLVCDVNVQITYSIDLS
jgi:hypothetical protein